MNIPLNKEKWSLVCDSIMITPTTRDSSKWNADRCRTMETKWLCILVDNTTVMVIESLFPQCCSSFLSIAVVITFWPKTIGKESFYLTYTSGSQSITERSQKGQETQGKNWEAGIIEEHYFLVPSLACSEAQAYLVFSYSLGTLASQCTDWASTTCPVNGTIQSRLSPIPSVNSQDNNRNAYGLTW